MILGYIDAGTGSLILQTVLGGAAGLVVFFKTVGRRFFRSKGSSGAPAPATEIPAEQATES